MKNINLSIIIVLLLSSCFRLDDNLYNLSEKITEYKLDKYTGEQDFILDDSYKIPESLIHLFTLSSQSQQEVNPTTIYALYIGDPSRIKTDTVIVYCHGNKWHMDFYWQRAKLLANTGGKNNFGVLMIDYRGYGLSEGEPTEDGLTADVSAGIEWLMANGLSSDRLIMYGFSMGSAPACRLTAHPQGLTPLKLIMEAPFASAAVMVHDASQLAMPASYFTNLKIENSEEIKTVAQPYLWLHGTSDLFLNYKTHGQVVYDNYKGTFKEFHLVEGADHGEVPLKFGFQRYNDALRDFIRKK